MSKCVAAGSIIGLVSVCSSVWLLTTWGYVKELWDINLES